MFGFSVFLHDGVTERMLFYMKRMVESGFKGIFTSIHIPEDDDSKYYAGLQKLGSFAREHQVDLVVDISGSALEKIGISFSDLSPLREVGITGIRIDYGISMELVAQASREIKIALNASTISPENLDALKQYRANFANMEAWHNYYPRPETGLGKKAFAQQNLRLKEAGFRVMAFVPGDGEKRGPLFEGLPTLEKHRHARPLAAALELLAECQVDKVFIGDPSITDESMEQFAYLMERGGLLLHASPASDSFEGRSPILTDEHSNRMDAARDVIRSQEARLLKQLPIAPHNTVERPLGSVTVDNEDYGRYAGELQITLKDLPKDERVNVLGRVRKSDRPLLAYCKPGQTFKIKWRERE